jgi:hypothetical protein
MVNMRPLSRRQRKALFRPRLAHVAPHPARRHRVPPLRPHQAAGRRSVSHLRRQQQRRLFPVRPLPVVARELVQLQVTGQVNEAHPPMVRQEAPQQQDLAFRVVFTSPRTYSPAVWFTCSSRYPAPRSTK